MKPRSTGVVVTITLLVAAVILQMPDGKGR